MEKELLDEIQEWANAVTKKIDLHQEVLYRILGLLNKSFDMSTCQTKAINEIITVIEGMKNGNFS